MFKQFKQSILLRNFAITALFTIPLLSITSAIKLNFRLFIGLLVIGLLSIQPDISPAGSTGLLLFNDHRHNNSLDFTIKEVNGKLYRFVASQKLKLNRFAEGQFQRLG